MMTVSTQILDHRMLLFMYAEAYALFITSKMRQDYYNAKRILCIFVCNFFLMPMTSCLGHKQTLESESDRLALLDFKNGVLSDPHKTMSSWNDSMHLCDWVGVTCNTTTGRVQVLNLKARNLAGSISPSLGNLTYLNEIYLEQNNFHGSIPQELGRLLQLRRLNLSFNNFNGEIPVNISHCSELISLSCSYNEFVGQIPKQLSALTKLNILLSESNYLTGTIPSWIGNLSSILALTLGFNKFHGNIPSELGRLSKLQLLSVYGNNLTGTVPPSIYNITSLSQLSLALNQLQGTLPHNIGFTLPNLRNFYAAGNDFRGPIPTSFANVSNLQKLDLSDNSLTGTLPDGLGALKNLVLLNFNNNKLGSGKVGDLHFISSLANCTGLMGLGLSGNRFGGELPSSVGNLSVQMTILYLGDNLLSGRIPAEIGNLVNLQIFGVDVNSLNGSIPSNIMKLQNLGVMYLNGNELSGRIPSQIGNLSFISELYMNDNRLEGSIPPSLGQCKSLQSLVLANNSLSGAIPKEVIGLSSLSKVLFLYNNLLTGPLPYEVGQLVNLAFLDVSANKLSGNIPSSLGQCIIMVHLGLSGNQFEGTIPYNLEALRGLEYLDLSSNDLSGRIPQFLCSFTFLKYLNLSYNSFDGQVPKEGVFSNTTILSIMGNKNLCGGVKELYLPPCPSNQTHSFHKSRAPNVLIPIVSTVTFVVILLSIIFVCFMLKKSRNKASPSSSSSSKNVLPQISFSQLSKSTNGFSEETLIGSGSFGSVYKGILPNDGSVVAIKVLNLQQQGASKSFIHECNALASIRHRNLLKIITSCSSIDVRGNEFKALVFDFMSNGNLDTWLHSVNNGPNQRRLSFIQRLDIAIGIASALDYLHNDCETPIVHCDLKPSNVLLDDDMLAHVGDFGLARFILEGSNPTDFSQTMSVALKGSIGYIPPEYGTGGRISIEGDIFSYGILLLEMIIGKRPTDETFVNGVDIHKFIAMALHEGALLSIVDHSLISEETRQEEEEENEDMIAEEMVIMNEQDRTKVVPKWKEECLISLMRVGLACSSAISSERTSMKAVVNELQAIRRSHLKFITSTRFHRTCR